MNATLPSQGANSAQWMPAAHLAPDPHAYYRVPVRKAGLTNNKAELNIGDESTLKDAWLLRRHINLIIHCAYPPFRTFAISSDISLKRVELRHDAEQSFALLLSDLINLVNEELMKGQNVLICCASGRTHSAALLLAYLMRFDRKTLLQALAFMNVVTAEVKLTKDLQNVLSKFERLSFDSDSVVWEKFPQYLAPEPEEEPPAPQTAKKSNADASSSAISENSSAKTSSPAPASTSASPSHATLATQTTHEHKSENSGAKSSNAMQISEDTTENHAQKEGLNAMDTDTDSSDEYSEASSHSSSNTAALSKSSSGHSKPRKSSTSSASNGTRDPALDQDADGANKKMSRLEAMDKNRLVEENGHEIAQEPAKKKKRFIDVGAVAAEAVSQSRTTLTMTIIPSPKPHQNQSKTSTPSASPAPKNVETAPVTRSQTKSAAKPVSAVTATARAPPQAHPVNGHKPAPRPHPQPTAHAKAPYANAPSLLMSSPTAPPMYPFPDYMMYPTYWPTYGPSPYATSPYPSMQYAAPAQSAAPYPRFPMVSDYRPYDMKPQQVLPPITRPVMPEAGSDSRNAANGTLITPKPADSAVRGKIKAPPIHNTRSASPAQVDSAAHSLLSLLHASEESPTPKPSVPVPSPAPKVESEPPSASSTPPAQPAVPRNKVPSLLSPAQLTRGRQTYQKPATTYNVKKWGSTNWAHRAKPARPVPAGNLTPVQRNTLADDLRVPSELLNRNVASQLPQFVPPSTAADSSGQWLVVKPDTPQSGTPQSGTPQSGTPAPSNSPPQQQ